MTKKRTQNKLGRDLLKIWPYSIPVFAGYLSLGAAFGLLLQQNGYGPLWALGMSLFVFAGSAQFLGVGLLAAGATLLQTALLVGILNFRHFFYGLSMIARYKDTGKKKWYLIFGLTDETYAILSSSPPPDGVEEKRFYFLLTLMDHSYWVLGSVLGAALGQLLPINTEGLDFAMTALFAVLVVEQWKAQADHRPAIIGFLVIILSLIIFGPEHFLIPGLIVISALLLFLDHRTGKTGGRKRQVTEDG